MTHLTLKDARTRRGWSQVALAAAAGLTQQHISQLERGDIAEPGASTVSKLETALRVKPRTLIFPKQTVAA